MNKCPFNTKTLPKGESRDLMTVVWACLPSFPVSPGLCTNHTNPQPHPWKRCLKFHGASPLPSCFAFASGKEEACLLLLIPVDGVQRSQLWDQVVPFLMVAIIQVGFSTYHMQALYRPPGRHRICV